MRAKFARWSLSVSGAFVLLVLGGAAGAANQAGASAAGERGVSYRVTLITGDVVQLDVQPGGLQAATVQAAPRGDGLPQPSFQILKTASDVYVYPSDAAPYVGDELDRELFSVSKLVEQGLADSEAESLPVIVDYERAVGATPPAMVKEDTLESIDAAVAREPKGKAAAFGRAVAQQAARPNADEQKTGAATASTGQDLFAGIERIWLDERVEASLDVSIPRSPRETSAPGARQSRHPARPRPPSPSARSTARTFSPGSQAAGRGWATSRSSPTSPLRASRSAPPGRRARRWGRRSTRSTRDCREPRWPRPSSRAQRRSSRSDTRPGTRRS